MSLLRQPRLALMYAGSALNATGSWATIIALWGFTAYRFHAGAGGVALIGLAWTAPGAVISLVSGWPVDHFGPRATLIASDVAGLATALAMAASHSYGELVLLAVGSGTVGAFGRPAAYSLAPRLVDDPELLRANAVMNMAEQSAIVAGPLVAALVISTWDVRAAFLVDAATFAVGAVTVLPLRLRPVRAGAPPSFTAADVLAGLDLARRVTEIRRALLLALAVYCSWGAFLVMEPLYVRNVLHRSPATLGYLQTAFGIGLLAMTALLARLGDRVATLPALAASVIASGAAAALYVATGQLVVAMTGVFTWGVVTGFFHPPLQTLLQRSAPPSSHGRILATAEAANGTGGLVAIPLTGLVVSGLGIAGTGLMVGALLVAAGTAGLLVSRGRRGPAQEPAGAGRRESRAVAIAE